MDDETREALEMTKDELAARFDAGKPAKVRKGEDFVRRYGRLGDTTAERAEGVVLLPSGETVERIVIRRTEFAVYSTVESRSRHVIRRREK